MEIIVLSYTKYKEKSAIINAISAEGDISFLARSILAAKSKNMVLTNQLSIFDVSFLEGNFKYPMLKECKTILLSRQSKDNLDYLATLQLICELTTTVVQDEDKPKIFNYLKETIMSLKNNKDTLLSTLYYFDRLLKINGFSFEVNKCVFCGNKRDIVAFSFSDGGFVCRECFSKHKNDSDPLSKDQMILLRTISNARNISNLDKISYERKDAITILNKFIEFIYNELGCSLKSASLLNN